MSSVNQKKKYLVKFRQIDFFELQYGSFKKLPCCNLKKSISVSGISRKKISSNGTNNLQQFQLVPT